MEALGQDGGRSKKRIASGVELRNQFVVARTLGRLPSEIAGVSNCEFVKFEHILHDEADAAKHEAQKDKWDRMLKTI